MQMPTIGERLGNARRASGLSISEVAARTKIPGWVLQQVERDEFGALPGGIFTRGFVTTFARDVGLNAEDITAEYRATYEAPVIAADDEAAAAATAASHSKAVVHRAWGAMALVLALIGLGLILYQRSTPAPQEGATDESEPAAATGNADFAPTSLTASADSVSPAGTGGDSLRVDVRATGPLWIEATADGQPLAYRLMEPDERLSISADTEVRLRVGDAAALTYVVNGEPGVVAGGTGEIRELRITPENYRSYLAVHDEQRLP
jgi:cytoskeleton protein RodZ